MLNTNYTREIIMGQNWIVDHNNDPDMIAMLFKARDRQWTHAERWSIVYDFMTEHYPEVTGTIITGITYSLEG